MDEKDNQILKQYCPNCKMFRRACPGLLGQEQHWHIGCCCSSRRPDLLERNISHQINARHSRSFTLSCGMSTVYWTNNSAHTFHYGTSILIFCAFRLHSLISTLGQARIRDTSNKWMRLTVSTKFPATEDKNTSLQLTPKHPKGIFYTRSRQICIA